jgi:hypothetical protein
MASVSLVAVQVRYDIVISVDMASFSGAFFICDARTK